MLFAKAGWPSRQLLFSYSELNTPLPFMVFGWADNLFHGEIAGGRRVNLVGGLLTLTLVAYTGRKQLVLVCAALLGLLLNPYFYITSLYLYTDCMPILLVLMGLYAYGRGWFWLMALAFGLSICARQYMVVFPAGILIWEGVPALLALIQTRRWPSKQVFTLLVANGLACCVLLGWRLFWGDWAQPAEVASQGIATQQWHIEFSLYGLACMGLYFALPIEAMQWVIKPLRSKIPASLPLWPTVLLLLVAVAFCNLFVIQPTQPGIDLGPLERVLNLALQGINNVFWVKPAVYSLLIVVGLRRFRLVSLPGIWLVLQAVLWAKVHIGWDKYTYPLIVVYWYLLVLPIDPYSANTRVAATQATPDSLPVAS